MSAMYQRDGGRLTDRERRAFALWVSRISELLATEPSKGGRPGIELPPDVARAVLNDVANGDTYSRIVERYRPVATFSRKWLRSALGDGRIKRMAGDG